MSRVSSGEFNAVIEKTVSTHTGKQFRIQAITECKTDAMHPAVIAHGESYDVFVKEGGNPFSPDQFDKEAKELDYLKAHTGVRTPEVLGVENTDGTALLILEAVKEVKPESPADFEKLGQGLAAIHRAQSDYCGFDYKTYLGIFCQDNTKKSSWSEFYGECRLRDSMAMAVKAGNMNAAQCGEIEKLIAKLPEICPSQTRFSLLHGDPWLGNLMYDGKGLVAIDCALYYGNREIDLTTVDFFCPVPQRFFDAYHEAYPIEEGFKERADLWKLNQWLGHVALFGEKYIGRVLDIVHRYLVA